MGKVTFELKSLNLTYFKGVKSLKVDFSHVTNIFGDNETNKSTIADAFSWLFFGKNMAGQSQFGIKTTVNGRIIERVDHSVEAIFLVNGEETTAKKTMKEKWVKKKGAFEKTFEGHETDYWYNEVPLSKADFSKKIADIFDENIFKLITDPLAFNNLHWEKARQILIDIEPGQSDEVVAKGNQAFEALIGKLTNKTFKEYKKQLAEGKRNLDKALKDIPPRIDEVHQGKPKTQDFDAETEKLEGLKKEYSAIETQIEDRNKASDKVQEEKTKNSNDQFTLTSKNQNISFELKQEINKSLSEAVADPNAKLIKEIAEIDSNIQSKERGLDSLKNELSEFRTKLPTAEKNLKNKQDAWEVENAKELKLDDHTVACPVCKRTLDDDAIEADKIEMLADFKRTKADRLLNLNKEGVAVKNILEGIEKSIKELEPRVTTGNQWVIDTEKVREAKQALLEKASSVEKPAPPNVDELLTKELASHKEYQANLKEIARLQTLIDNVKGVDIADLKEKKTAIQQKIDACKLILADKEKIDTADARIKELKAEETKLAAKLLAIEKDQYTADEFTKVKISSLERKINARFKNVNFKMYNQMVNGGEEETCIALYKGVEFNDVNTAGKIQMGLDIINTLCAYYQVNATIFIDNAEGITNIPETDSQQIRLIVSKGVKTLRVE
jgi:exonuclease SbcC